MQRRLSFELGLVFIFIYFWGLRYINIYWSKLIKFKIFIALGLGTAGFLLTKGNKHAARRAATIDFADINPIRNSTKFLKNATAYFMKLNQVKNVYPMLRYIYNFKVFWFRESGLEGGRLEKQK